MHCKMITTINVIAISITLYSYLLDVVALVVTTLKISVSKFQVYDSRLLTLVTLLSLALKNLLILHN